MHLIFQLSTARRRAMAAARAETLALLERWGPTLPEGGPLGEIGGLFWVDLASEKPDLPAILPLLGYTDAAFELVRLPSPPAVARPISASTEALPAAVRWRGGWWSVRERWRRDAVEERESAPDRRAFLLPGADGEVREVRGYRGGRRGLPPADARLVVNLALVPGCRRLLDPFAGAGGIVAAARRHGLEVVSTDVDPFLRHGLAGLGARHCIADARRLPFPTGCVDGVATEPPYAPELEPVVAASLGELARVTRPGGRICVFCSREQAPAVVAAARAPLTPRGRFSINRKGTDCEALVWDRE